jgi:hypothetical protein
LIWSTLEPIIEQTQFDNLEVVNFSAMDVYSGKVGASTENRPICLAQHASFAKRMWRKLLLLIQIKIENCERVKIGTPVPTGRYG